MKYLYPPLLALLLLSSLTVSYAAEDDLLTRSEAILILGSKFPLPPQEQAMEIPFDDVEDSTLLHLRLQEACANQILSCTDVSFEPTAYISSPAFLKLLYSYMKHQGANDFFATVDNDQEWYAPYITTAKRRGLVADQFFATQELSISQAEEIISRASLLHDYYFLVPYFFPGLVDSTDQFEALQINSLYEIERVKKEYDNLYLTLLNSMRTTEGYTSKVAYAYNIMQIRALKMLVDEKHDYILDHPLMFDPAYDDDIRKRFNEFDIKEVVGVGYYDFRNNAPYRKNNVRNSLDNIEGLVLKPGEEFDYWKVMDEQGGLGDIGNGWVILDGKEKWAWGGGLCGTATAIFRSAWFSGLEITERRPHSIYYGSLYNSADIGLDAAVYQNSPNLRFKNNTGNNIMMHIIWNDTRDEAWVQVLGTKHFDNISFSGLETEGWQYKRSRTLQLPGEDPVTESIYSSYNKVK